MKIVTGYAGRAHITSQDQQHLNRGVVGPDMYVLGVGNEFEAELTDSTTITISDGDGVIQGCQFRINSGETESVVMPDGESGMFRNDLIVARYSKVPETGVEDVSLVVLRGESQETDYTQVLPDYLTGDIDEGDTVDFPLYRVHFSGFTIDGIVPLFLIIPSIDSLYRMHESLANTVDRLLNWKDAGSVQGSAQWIRIPRAGTHEIFVQTLMEGFTWLTMYIPARMLSPGSTRYVFATAWQSVSDGYVAWETYCDNSYIYIREMYAYCKTTSKTETAYTYGCYR